MAVCVVLTVFRQCLVCEAQKKRECGRWSKVSEEPVPAHSQSLIGSLSSTATSAIIYFFYPRIFNHAFALHVVYDVPVNSLKRRACLFVQPSSRSSQAKHAGTVAFLTARTCAQREEY
jgi:hypothetical protein